MSKTVTFKVVCVDHATSEMIVEENQHSKVKGHAAPRSSILEPLQPNHVVLSYIPYKDTIHPHIGDKVTFLVEGSVLEYRPSVGEFEPIEGDVHFSQDSRHQLFMYENRLVFCTALHASKVSECLKVIDVLSGTVETPLCTDLQPVRARCTDCQTELYNPNSKKHLFASSSIAASKSSSKKFGKSDAGDEYHKIHSQLPSGGVSANR